MPIELWPSFWKTLKELIQKGDIVTSISIKNEILKGNDELTEWIKEYAPEGFYIEHDEEILLEYQKTQEWARNRGQYTESALSVYGTVADAFLVATAAAKKLTLVTYEAPAPESKKAVKIPDACQAAGVRYCDLNKVFQELGVTI